MCESMKSRLFRQTLLAILPLIVLVSALLPGAASAAPPDLFTAVTAPRGVGPAGQEMAVVRRRPVGLNLAPLGGGVAGQAAQSITLNLFDDVMLTADMSKIERRSQGRYTWFGSIPGDSMSEVIIVVQDGVVAGNIVYKGRMYQVRPTASGTQEVREIDQSAFPSEVDPIPVLTPLVAPDSAPIVMADSGAYIDVMVVYTTAVKNIVGAGNMTAFIQLAVDETNQSYANSGISQRINLVHSEEVNYTESATFDTDLDRLTNPSDGYMDNVHTLRDQYHADLVSLWINNTQYCGLAWLMAPTVSPSFESYAFSVVHYGCATGYYSFGHEMGHNMAARHDRYVDNTNTPFTYNHGYVDTTHRWRTVMAYNNACSAQGFSCTRLQYWSNPAVFYGGFPMGIADGDPAAADNRLTLDSTAFTVANFRTSCAYTITPSSASFSAAGGSGSFSVNTDGGCPWTASESLGWVSITSGSSGSGPGTVNYTVSSNSSVTPRSGNINAADKTFVINQAGVLPTANFSGSPTSGTAPFQVVFSNTSTNASSWLWDFGDGGSSTLQNPSHTYQTGGASFTVKLTATNANGSVSTTKSSYISASTCGSATVRYGLPPSSYTPAASISAAYGSASDGDEIDMQAVPFTAVLTFGSPKTVTLKGGYDCAYSATRIPGTVIGSGSTTVTISGGTIIFDQVAIK